MEAGPGTALASPSSLQQQQQQGGGAMSEVRRLESELKEKQHEFIRRERAYKVRVSELRDELSALKADKSKWMEHDPGMVAVKGLHAEILSKVGQLQSQTVRLVQEQERDLLGAFRSRLVDVRRELDKERAKKDDGAGAWIERSRKLELEVDTERQRADRLDRVNRNLGEENARLKREVETQRDDTAFLKDQLGAVNGENERLRRSIEAKRAELGEMREEQQGKEDEEQEGGGHPPPGGGEASRRASAAKGAPAAAVDPRLLGGPRSDAAYRDMIKKLNKMLQMERKHVESVKEAHRSWRERRTALELSLREAVAATAARVEERNRRSASASLRSKGRQDKPQQSDDAACSSLDPALLASFTHQDRESAIQLWLSYDGVLEALYNAGPRPTSISEAAAGPGNATKAGGGVVAGHEKRPASSGSARGEKPTQPAGALDPSPTASRKNLVLEIDNP